MEPSKPNPYLSPAEACAYVQENWNLPCKPATLNRRRVIGGGPQYVKFGRVVRYTPTWLDQWVEDKLSAPVRSSFELKAAQAAAPGIAARSGGAPDHAPARDIAAAGDLQERMTYDIAEAAALLGIGRNAAYGAARSGQIPTIRIGKRLLVPKAALERMV